MQQEFIPVGQSRAFTFQASSGTGYVWMLAELPAGAWLESVQTSSVPMPGAPCTTTFVIVGASDGFGVLRFVLARPWQPSQTAGEQAYQLRVGSSSPIMPLYAAALQHAKASGDVARMRSLAALAEQQLGSSAEITKALTELKAELATRGSGPVPPYGVAIQEALASGDVATMRRAEAAATSHLDEIQRALGALRGEIQRGGGPVIPLYGAALQQALASGDVARMRSVVSQAEAAGELPPDAASALAEIKAHLAQLRG
jgi:Domain of unknown function (DUF1843)/Chagasin family peptidase inhibitor I42